MRASETPVLFAAALLLAAPAAQPTHAQGLALDTQLVTSGLVRPLGIVDPGDGSGRLFLVQQTGEIRIWNGVALEATPFLDLSGLIDLGNEKGLLGLVFHPDFAANGRFFVNYTRNPGGGVQTVIARYQVSAGDPDVADPGSEQILLTVDQPANNHNAGDLAFGPDGYLYVPLGDGGGGGDPNENAQDLSTLLGSILRIDVASTDPPLDYAIPPDNPFVGVAGARDEIWSHGLRNPFRLAFDRETGDLWIGDVGQQTWEEIDFQPAASPGGENYGWDCREGAHDYDDPNGDLNATCTGAGHTEPALEYLQVDGRCAVTGGFRYRGDTYPRLRSVYLYADFCTGEVFGSVPRCDGAWESRILLDTPFRVTTFGQDAAGELYLTDRVNSDDPESEVHHLILAAGSGGPDLQPSSATLDFGTVEVGDTVTLPFSLTNANAGPEAAAVTSRALSDAARFTLHPAGGGQPPCRSGGRPCLPPGASCSMAIELQASSPGMISESLAFEGNFAPETIALTANVVPCSSDVDLTVEDLVVMDGQSETRRACDTLTAGPSVTVEAGGELTLQAGTRIVLGDGFQVQAGGSLTLGTF